MDVEVFKNLCSDLNENLAKIVDGTASIYNNGSDIMIAINCDVQGILESDGLINSDDPNIRNIFGEVFDAVRGIKLHTQSISHYKSEKDAEMKKMQSNRERLIELDNQFTMQQSHLASYYQKAFDATKKAMELGMTK